MTEPTYEQRIARSRELICEIARVWDVTCSLDIDVEIHLPDAITVRIEHIPRADEE